MENREEKMKKPSEVVRDILKQIIINYSGSVEVEEILLDLLEQYTIALKKEWLDEK